MPNQNFYNCVPSDGISPQPRQITNTQVPLEIDGEIETRSISEWCKYFDVPYVNARMRYTRGKRGVDIFNTRHVQHPHSTALNLTVSALPEHLQVRFVQHAIRLEATPHELLEAMVTSYLKKLDSSV
jgi:hypothetical protein